MVRRPCVKIRSAQCERPWNNDRGWSVKDVFWKSSDERFEFAKVFSSPFFCLPRGRPWLLLSWISSFPIKWMSMSIEHWILWAYISLSTKKSLWVEVLKTNFMSPIEKAQLLNSKSRHKSDPQLFFLALPFYILSNSIHVFPSVSAIETDESNPELSDVNWNLKK